MSQNEILILEEFHSDKGILYTKRCMYVDAYALIVQQDGDGGDTLQREGMYAFGKWLRYNSSNNSVVITEPPGREDPGKIMNKLEVEPGVFVRHPDPNKWYSNPKTTSRDQIVPLIAYCAAYRDYPRLWRLFKNIAKRGMFLQNTKRAGEGHMEFKVPDTMIARLGLFIRAGGWYTAPFYPLLFFTDSIELAGTILNQIPIHWEQTNKRFRWKDLRDVDDNNTVIAHLLAAKFKPTPISWLDRRLYAYTRRLNYGNTRMGETNPVMGALVWYHRASNRGNPEMAELYRPLVLEYFAPQDDLERLRIEVTTLFSKFSDRILMVSR